jgi:hypothetical protein
MQNFDLAIFLRNHKPKTLESFFSPLRNSYLRGYHIYHRRKTVLIPGRTYIKIIEKNKCNPLGDNNWEEIIKRGGIVIAGGIYSRGKIESAAPELWTHLRLKLEYLEDDKKKYKIYLINLSKYYIFYKIFQDRNDKVRNFMVQLIKKI